MALATYLGAVGIERFFIPGFLTRHRKRGVFLRDEVSKYLPFLTCLSKLKC
jgi:hypothetical protein